MESFSDRDVSRSAGTVHVCGIDALRALAMAAVVADHSRIFTFGWSGVWLFYVISGFVVTGTLSSRPRINPATDIRDFYLRRCARILPAYYLWVAVAVVASLAQGFHPLVSTVESLIFFFHNFAMAGGWGDISGFGVGNLWTVSVEMQFYALYGLLFMIAPRKFTVSCLLLTLFACPVARFLYGSSMDAQGVPALDAAYRVYSFSALHFDSFAYGCLLSLSRHRVTPRVALTVAWVAVAGLVIYLGAYTTINIRNGAHGLSICKNLVSGILFGQHREAFVYLPVDWAATGVICFVLTSRRLNRALALPILIHVGKVSYGAYLYHGAMLTLAGLLVSGLPSAGLLRFGTRSLQFLIAMGFVVALATLSFAVLEQPITRRIGRALSGRLQN